MDELLEELDKAGFTVIGYADDIAILVKGKHEPTVMEVMADALNRTLNWCERVGLHFPPFTNRRKLINEPLLVNNNELQYGGEVKYLQ